MWINVVLAIDERLDDVKACVESLRKVYGLEAPVALATYGGAAVPFQPAVAAYAADQKILYYDSPRQDWLTEDDTKEWHASEALSRIQITKYFADLGYEETYIMHADVRILGNFRSLFLKEAQGAWSFIAILLRAREPFEDLCDRGSWSLYFEGNPARLADILVRYNPEFVNRIYQEYRTTKGIWDMWLSNFMLWSDLTQFDLARLNFGFKGQFLPEKDDHFPMCWGTILHLARQTVPDCVSSEKRMGFDKAAILRNYERRTCRT
jgi:hypothetical protein